MKERSKSKFLTGAIVLLGAYCSFTVAPALAASTVNFKLIRGYVIVIPVTVNGAGHFEFALDTGSNTTIISAEFARELRLRPIDRVELVTATGSQIVPRARLESLSVGARTVNDPEALIGDLRGVRAVRPEIRGVLGMNFLAQFNFLINYRERRIEFEDEDEFENCLPGAPLPIEWHDGQALINSTGKESLRLKLDSGISTLILFNAGGRRPGLNFAQGQPQSLQLSGDPGSQAVWQKRLRSFSVGGADFYDLPVALMESTAASKDRAEDGLLPTSIFQRVYFNCRKRFVMLNPK